MAMKEFSNERITPRLFEKDWMERFSRVHPIVPVILYVPVVMFFLIRGIRSPEITVPTLMGLFLAGTLGWTLLEYLLHRFVFHLEPKNSVGQRFMFLMHGIHHAYPRDPQRLVMPPIVSIPLALVSYALLRWALGPVYVAPFFSGFVLGYIFYDTIHFATHHFAMKGRLSGSLKRHHLRHHYNDPEHRYGVSSPLWDYILGTMPPHRPDEEASARPAS